MKTIYETLEMNIIQNEIKKYCASTLGKDKVDSFDIFDDLDELNLSLEKVNEAMKVMNIQGRIPLGGLSNITLFLEKANRDGTLLPDELLKIYNHYSCIKSVKNYIINCSVKVTHINEMANNLEYNDRILNEIERCILPDATVSDHASSTLYSLRKKINQLKTQILHKMESLVKESKDMLSIDAMTSKNDRLVLPVKSGYKNQISGLVHAHSATGQTTYIEPEAVVLMNNQLGELVFAEKEEVERILYELSQLVKNNYYHCKFNLEILEELDFIFAKASFGLKYNCCIPQINRHSNSIILKGARHPLIDQKKVVENTIVLENHKMLLISGSNTGGKTVTLKTVGLLSLMALCGMCVPCYEMSIPMFDAIYVDLGDEQSIEQSLSTFSSHMKKIIDILHVASSNSLVIIDEIGSGTDPYEGASLAEAILSKFLSNGVFVFASTHYGQLKTFAKEHKNILMASVSFDLELMKPTYQLKLDTVGQSYAIEIASILGLDEDIVNHAQQIKSDSMSEHERLMEELAKKEEQLSLKEDELIHLLENNKKIEKQYIHQLNLIEKEKDKIIKEAKEEANQLIEQAIVEIDDIRKQLKESNIKDHEAIQAKHDLNQLIFKDEEEIIKQNHQLKVGDYVLVRKMKKEGEVVEIKNNHQIIVSLNGLNIKLHENEVTFVHEKVKPVKIKKANIKKTTVQKTGTYEINVIGKRYEEAMNLVEKFLDDALVLGYPHVRIIHGMGTGALRNGIRKMLERNKHVVSYRDGGPNEGGLGATLAYFE